MNIITAKRIIIFLIVGLITLALALFWLIFINDKETQKCEYSSAEKNNIVTGCPNNTELQYYSQTYESENGVEIKINGLKAGQIVEPPLILTGQVPGNWSFEADFPIKLSSNDLEITTTIAQLEGDWMTEVLVPFRANIDFATANIINNELQLVLVKDNPSGLPENDDKLEIILKTN